MQGMFFHYMRCEGGKSLSGSGCFRALLVLVLRFKLRREVMSNFSKTGVLLRGALDTIPIGRT